ncbi:MAG: DNA/RNA nuclease SfsA [Deltaproteobacteria bacterium]|nr:DNA/RNA nuclease SfsA [Deltaproteobacteria bacterium]
MAHGAGGSLVRGRLLGRPNRFLGEVELEDGRIVEAHIGDRGRLEDILYEGAEVHLAPSSNAARRTAFSLVLARCRPLMLNGPAVLTTIQPGLAGRWVEAAIGAGALPGVPRSSVLRREVRVATSRLDIEARPPRGEPILIEVKTAVAAAGTTALFPDAPSERARRHTRLLADLAGKGQHTMIVFVAPREDVREIRPHPVDPEFARCLREAKRQGVMLRGLGFRVELDGLYATGALPIVLS